MTDRPPVEPSSTGLTGAGLPAGDPPVADFGTPRRIHVVGAGGTGMAPLASALVGMGHQVTGSDTKASASLERLGRLGVVTWVGHNPTHVHDTELVTASSAVPAGNIELVEARRLGIPVVSRGAILTGMAALRRTVAVAGTHGKTTTSSMLALILTEAGLQPSFVIGGDSRQLGASARWGAGRWLVVEADESDGTFLELPAEVVVVTSVEADHLEYYGGLAAMEAAFGRFLRVATGPRVVCADDPVATRLAAGMADVVTYGTDPSASYRMIDVSVQRARTTFEVVHHDRSLGPVELAVPGLYNARNACAALVAAQVIGVDARQAAASLATFAGVTRRFELRGERDGITYADDYGHLPGEVHEVLAAARSGGWERIVAVFQPHRYSRTESLWQDFADAFEDADVVVVTDVYPAGEPPRPGITGRLVADAVRVAHPDRRVLYVADRAALVNELRALVEPGDLCLTFGAGDLTTVHWQLLDPNR